MKNRFKIRHVFSLVLITLVFSIAFARCGGGQKSTDDIENALKYIAENLDDATYSPIEGGSDFDYGFKDGWLLNKFEYIRSLMTYKEFQAKSGYPIYLSGPHTKDELNLNSYYTFGHYNPKFVKLLHKATLSLTSNKAFINNTKSLLEKYGILEFLEKHKEIYEITQEYPEEFNQIKSDFLKGIKDKTWEEGGYREMIPEQIYSDYYWNWSETSYHFWVRRDIDNTKDLWIGLISDVLDAYEKTPEDDQFTGVALSTEDGQPTIEWAFIPAGTFTMGSDDESETEHQVTLSAFNMSKYEVTFEQYDAFCDATGREKPDDEGWGRDNRPVINVSWEDATAFADWMGCRLPTEAEWEYACRAGTTTTFNTGDNLTTSQANYDGYNHPDNDNVTGEFREKTMPVGSFAPNAFGLYDMHGNVWELCSDWWESEYSSEAQTNPKGPSTGSYRAYRGGAWNSYGFYCASAIRNCVSPDVRDNHIGFRLVYPK